MWTFILACTSPSHEDGETAPQRPTEEETAIDPGATGPSPDPSDPPSVGGDPLAVCINELMPANVISTVDEGGIASDWIELHNPTDADLALDGWSLTDDPGDPQKDVLDGGLVLEAGGFLVLWADEAVDRGPTHLAFALSDEGESVALFAPDGTGSVVRYGEMIDDVAVARSSDCCFDEAQSCFGFTFAGTPGASNAE